MAEKHRTVESRRQKVARARERYYELKREDPEKHRRTRRGYRLVRQYKLTLADVERMLVEQEHKCASCGDNLTSYHVDHDHKTDKVRGLLCEPCNKGLGHFLDQPTRLRAAASYLERTCST